MALTFDDGPNTAWTPALLEVLAKHGVKATFFTIGHYAREQPSLLREVAAAGHAIGNHTYTHVTMPLHTDETIRRELRMTTQAIEEAGRRDGAGEGPAADAPAVRPPPPRHAARPLGGGLRPDPLVGDALGLEQGRHDREDHAQGREADPGRRRHPPPRRLRRGDGLGPQPLGRRRPT